SQSSPVGDPKAVAPTQASTTTTATVEPEIGAPTQPTFNTTIESLVVEDDFPVLDSNQSTENSSDSNHEDIFHEGDAIYESDVHEKNINLRAEKRSYQRRKRTERVPKDPKEVLVAEVGPDVGFDETELVDKNIKAAYINSQASFTRGINFGNVQETPFEAELKANLAHMALLGNKDIVLDLLHYDVKPWCKM
ncbi:hypothetical protein H5410_046992, partial [Solanum commersonii]